MGATFMEGLSESERIWAVFFLSLFTETLVGAWEYGDLCSDILHDQSQQPEQPPPTAHASQTLLWAAAAAAAAAVRPHQLQLPYWSNMQWWWESYWRHTCAPLRVATLSMLYTA